MVDFFSKLVGKYTIHWSYGKGISKKTEMEKNWGDNSTRVLRLGIFLNDQTLRIIQTSSPGGIDLWRSILDKIMVGNIQGLTVVVVVPAATLETLADLEPGWQTGTKKHPFYKRKQPRGNWEKKESIFGKGFDLLFFLHIFLLFQRKKKVEIARVWFGLSPQTPSTGGPFVRHSYHLGSSVASWRWNERPRSS